MNKIHSQLRLILLSFGIGSAAVQAATLTVGQPNTPCPNAQFTSISDAVKAAMSGDVIEICPALYSEQVLITKPLTLRGITMQGVSRVLLQPNPMVTVGGLPFQAVISVVNTSNVSIQNLTIDAGYNTVVGCGTGLSGIHFYNASGLVDNSSIGGAQLVDAASCPTIVSYPLVVGGGIGVQVDTDGLQTGPFKVVVTRSSIHDYGANGVLAIGSGVTATLMNNSLSGVGPAVGIKQFAVFVANGAVGNIVGNVINEGTCGALNVTDCTNLRSEGVVLRSAGDGTVVDSNSITNAQSGIFVNGAHSARITNNVIRNIDALDAIDIQGTASGYFTNSLISGNMIYNVGPFTTASANETGCGINEYPNSGVSENMIRGNTVNNAYCGVAVVAADALESGLYFNTLYATLNADQYPNTFPPALEPGQSNSPSQVSEIRRRPE